MGPVEYIVIGFPGNRFNGRIIPALKELVESGIINILDLSFIHKEDDGAVTVVELGEEDGSAEFDDLDGEVGFLLSESDLIDAAESLPPNTSAGILVWENVWAERFAQAVRGSGGEVIANARIPYDLVQAAIAYASAESA